VEQGLEVEDWSLWQPALVGEQDLSNGKGASPPDEGGWLREEDKPLDGDVLDSAAG
jgi:hypothetical protein